jgi:hypothetical protein
VTNPGLPWDDPEALRTALAGLRAEFPDGPNPDRIGACPECGNYRTDGRPPYLHHDGCSHDGDLQIDRFLAELAAGDLAGAPVGRWCFADDCPAGICGGPHEAITEPGFTVAVPPGTDPAFLATVLDYARHMYGETPEDPGRDDH